MREPAQERASVRPAGPSERSASVSVDGPRNLLDLHSAVGNRAFRQLVDDGRVGGGAVGPTGLPGAVLAGMEQAFGADLSSVRVHSASPEAAALGVRAFTRGTQVHLAPGQPQVASADGLALLGHELTHVVQQRQGRVTATTQALGHDINDDDALEREAEDLGRKAARGQRVDVGAVPYVGAPQEGGPLQGAGIDLLKAKDPAPTDTRPLRAWPVLAAAAAGNPTAVDVHQILLTYKKLSDGWKSGLGEVQQSLGNAFGRRVRVPESVIAYGGLVRSGGYTRGSSMTASLLTLRGPAGSDATTGSYANLGGCVEGHLLNALLHGPAEAKNLAPFTPPQNKKHSSEVEEPLKKMVYNSTGTFRYEVSVAPTTTDPIYPLMITCTVVELQDDGSPMADGYEQRIRIAPSGTVTPFGVNRTESGPGRDDPLDFDAEGPVRSAAAQTLADQWNDLLIPWSEPYGQHVAVVLETAYAAIRKYEAALGRVGSAALALPPTRVIFETGTFKDMGYFGNMVDVPMGVRMVADPLTLRPPLTGETGFEPQGPAWGLGSIRGHLLNHHLHGPAEPRNLAPMSGSLNQRFERDVESAVKQMVLSEGRVVRYEVTLSGEGDQFGLEGVPETLTWSVKEYRRAKKGDPETLKGWILDERTELRGTLRNNRDAVDAAFDFDDGRGSTKRRRTTTALSRRRLAPLAS
jgi:hypothetical protein